MKKRFFIALLLACSMLLFSCEPEDDGGQEYNPGTEQGGSEEGSGNGGGSGDDGPIRLPKDEI